MHRALPFFLAAVAAFANPPHHHSGTGIVALDVFARGDTVDLLVAGQHGEKPALFHQRSTDGGATWRARTPVGGPPPFGPRRGNDPQIAAARDRLVAVWMTAGTDKWGSGPMATALSTDGGKTWTPGPNPADDGSTAGHGFMDITHDGSRFHLVWLDSRDGRQGLRHASSPDGTQWSANISIKPGTCECCPNTLAAAPGRIAVLYRDHDPRDMRAAVSTDAGATWKHDTRAGEFDWKFDGCPHAGGGIAFARGALHALVWTGHAGQAGVHFLTSPDGGKWSAPLRIGPADASHPDLASDGTRLAATWLAGGAAWAAISPDGTDWNTPVRISGTTAQMPRVIATKRGFRVFWTETPEGKATVWRSEPLVFR
jgi:hypothetical protein